MQTDLLQIKATLESAFGAMNNHLGGDGATSPAEMANWTPQGNNVLVHITSALGQLNHHAQNLAVNRARNVAAATAAKTVVVTPPAAPTSAPAPSTPAAPAAPKA